MKPSLPSAAGPTPGPAAAPALPRRAALLGVGLLAAALHGAALGNGFVWDDRAQILANRWLGSWSHVPEIFASGVWDFEGLARTNYYRPLMHLVDLAVYQAFGPAPWAFHAVSLLAHAAAAALVVLLAEALLGAPAPRLPWPALAAGLVFAAHPVHVEAVAWIAALPDVAGTALAIGALLLLAREVRRGGAPRPAPLAAAGALTLASLLFKETFVVLPVLALAVELLLGRGEGAARRAARVAPFVAAAVAYLAIRLAVLGAFAPQVEGHGLAPGHALAEGPALLARYVALLALPVELSAWHELTPAGNWLGAAGIAGLVAAALAAAGIVVAWRRSAVAAFGLVLAGAAIAPALYTTAISGGRFAERYLYFPSCGAALAVAGALAAAAARPQLVRAGWIAVGAVTVAGGAATAARVPVWHDEVSLWVDAARSAPDAAIPRYNLGSALLELRRPDEAAAQLRAALALGLPPTARAAALVNLGNLSEQAGRPGEAVALYRDAVAADPRSASAHANLGGALAESGRAGEALEHLRTAARLRPDQPGLRYNLGLVLSDLGRLDEARAELEAAARLDPRDARIAATLRALGAPTGGGGGPR